MILRPAVAALCLFATTLPAAAQDICAPLLDFIGHARGGTSPVPWSGAEACATATSESGAQEVYCYWSHPLRDPAAAQAAKTLTADIRTCLPGVQVLPADQPVNHPDSYDLRRFRAGDLIVSLAVKDKAALVQILVFLRAQLQSPD